MSIRQTARCPEITYPKSHGRPQQLAGETQGDPAARKNSIYFELVPSVHYMKDCVDNTEGLTCLFTMMNKKIFPYFLLLLLFSLFLVQCSNPVSSPPEIPIEVLLSAPDTLLIENQNVVLSTYMWRDFQPISPPDGKPLIAITYIETVDSTIISSSIVVDAIYIVNNGEVWKSFFSDEEPASTELRPYRIVKIARNGPKWGPGIYVSVIVRLKKNTNSYLLRASEQYIGRTD